MMNKRSKVLIPVIGLLAGAALGGLIGFFGQCSGST